MHNFAEDKLTSNLVGERGGKKGLIEQKTNVQELNREKKQQVGNRHFKDFANGELRLVLVQGFKSGTRASHLIKLNIAW